MAPNVLMVAAEAAPLAKSGGLGDMVSACASALRQRGIDVSILLPGYESAFDQALAPTPLGYLRDLPGGDARLWRAAMPDTGVPVLLLEMNHLYGHRGSGLYQDDEGGRDYLDNFVRFASLSAAAARIASGVRGVKRPHIVHAHDWHTGLTPLLMKLAGAPARSVFTIHNLAFQGNYPPGLAPYAGIPSELLAAAPHEPHSIEFYGALSCMKAAIVYADRLSAVSERYAREILTPRFGNRMEGVLEAHRDKLSGIVNGIDDTLWDPRHDSLIAQDYGVDDLVGKHACKRALQQSYGLPTDPFAPLVAIGSRLTTQKLADRLCEAIPAALERWPRAQFAVLGQGEASIEYELRQLAARWPGRLGVHIGYDEPRAHRLHAGADILLHASRFEPCGLTQLYAMRYGTIPVASRVGGLADTILDHRAADAAPDEHERATPEQGAHRLPVRRRARGGHRAGARARLRSVRPAAGVAGPATQCDAARFELGRADQALSRAVPLAGRPAGPARGTQGGAAGACAPGSHRAADQAAAGCRTLRRRRAGVASWWQCRRAAGQQRRLSTRFGTCPHRRGQGGAGTLVQMPAADIGMKISWFRHRGELPTIAAPETRRPRHAERIRRPPASAGPYRSPAPLHVHAPFRFRSPTARRRALRHPRSCRLVRFGPCRRHARPHPPAPPDRHRRDPVGAAVRLARSGHAEAGRLQYRSGQ